MKLRFNFVTYAWALAREVDPWSPHTTGLRVWTGTHERRQSSSRGRDVVGPLFPSLLHARARGQRGSFLVLSLQTLRLPTSDL